MQTSEAEGGERWCQVKAFAIKATKDKSTVAVVAQVYDKATRRTTTSYVGSFNKCADPATLPGCIKLGKGAETARFTAELGAELARPWLAEFGAFGKPTQESLELLERVRNELRAEFAATRRSELWVDFALKGAGDWLNLYHLDGEPVVGQGIFTFGPMRLFSDSSADDIVRWFVDTHGEGSDEVAR